MRALTVNTKFVSLKPTCYYTTSIHKSTCSLMKKAATVKPTKTMVLQSSLFEPTSDAPIN